MPADLALDDSYDDFPRIEDAFSRMLDESLGPRGPDSLWEQFERLSPPADGIVVDIGCGEGEDSIEIRRRYGLSAVGVNPVQRPVELAEAAASSAGVDDRVSFQTGTAEATGVSAQFADVIWAKEPLMFVDLDEAFAEFQRVLRPGGTVFLYQVCTGPQMSDDEAASFSSAAAGAASVRPQDIVDAAENGGFTELFRVDFGGEWGELAQEQTGAGGQRLVHAARRLRDPERYVAEFGETNY